MHCHMLDNFPKQFGPRSGLQGRRRVFQSGPAEEAIECRRHERGESTRVGLINPLSLGGFGGASPEKIFEF